jgi:hypothetical protein
MAGCCRIAGPVRSAGGPGQAGRCAGRPLLPSVAAETIVFDQPKVYLSNHIKSVCGRFGIDPAAHVSLDKPHLVAVLLETLRRIGATATKQAESQAENLANRATNHGIFSDAYHPPALRARTRRPVISPVGMAGSSLKHRRLLMITRKVGKPALLTRQTTAGQRPAVAHDRREPTPAPAPGTRRAARWRRAGRAAHRVTRRQTRAARGRLDPPPEATLSSPRQGPSPPAQGSATGRTAAAAGIS